MDQEFLNSLERSVAILETSHNLGKGVFEGLRPWFTLGDVLGAVVNYSTSGDNELHVNICTPYADN